MTQDYAAAMKWYRKAAEQGNASAQVSLGAMYLNGQGMPQDYAAAMKWVRKAANQGEALAQYDLGVLYSRGLGVTRDYVQAHMWFKLAAARGQIDAGKWRDSLAKLMTPAQIAEAQKLAREWNRKGSKK